MEYRKGFHIFLKQIISKCGCDGLFSVWNNEKQDALTFDKRICKKSQEDIFNRLKFDKDILV
jgi:hypothetical protein